MTATQRAQPSPAWLIAALLLPWLPLPTYAQQIAAPAESRLALSPRLAAPAWFESGGRPPGMPSTVEGIAHPHRPSPDVASRAPIPFAAEQPQPQPTEYFSIKDPCAKEHLNRSDEPLSQRTNCAGLGIPSGWFQMQPHE